MRSLQDGIDAPYDIRRNVGIFQIPIGGDQMKVAVIGASGKAGSRLSRN